MFDPDAEKAIFDQTEPFESVAPEGEATPAAEALWRSWQHLAYELQELGVKPASMCETTNTIASVRADIHERTGAGRDTAR